MDLNSEYLGQIIRKTSQKTIRSDLEVYKAVCRVNELNQVISKVAILAQLSEQRYYSCKRMTSTSTVYHRRPPRDLREKSASARPSSLPTPHSAPPSSCYALTPTITRITMACTTHRASSSTLQPALWLSSPRRRSSGHRGARRSSPWCATTSTHQPKSHHPNRTASSFPKSSFTTTSPRRPMARPSARAPASGRSASSASVHVSSYAGTSRSVSRPSPESNMQTPSCGLAEAFIAAPVVIATVCIAARDASSEKRVASSASR